MVVVYLPLESLLGLGLEILAQSSGIGSAQRLTGSLALLGGLAGLGLCGTILGSIRLAAVPPARRNRQRLS